MKIKSIFFQILLIATVIIGHHVPIYADIKIVVSPIYSELTYANNLLLNPVKFEGIVLKDPGKDHYEVYLDFIYGGINFIAIDRRDVLSNNPSPQFLLNKVIDNSVIIKLPYYDLPKGASFVFKSTSNSNINLKLKVYRVGNRSEEVTSEIKKWLSVPTEAINAIYKVPNITVTIKPGKQVNAFSDPNVTICTELFADLMNKGLEKAIYPILLHELAHSLLYLWGLPGYDNEDMADEFAATILSQGDRESIDTYIKWLEGNDSVTEAIVQLANGDRHTLSIQRARNIKSALNRSDDLLQRWGKMLSGFEQKPNK